MKDMGDARHMGEMPSSPFLKLPLALARLLLRLSLRRNEMAWDIGKVDGGGLMGGLLGVGLGRCNWRMETAVRVA